MKTNRSVCLFAASSSPSSTVAASTVAASCASGQHKHVTPKRATELLASGFVHRISDRAVRWTKRGELASLARVNERLAIRGMSCKYGPYILTNAPVHVVMREAIAGG